MWGANTKKTIGYFLVLRINGENNIQYTHYTLIEIDSVICLEQEIVGKKWGGGEGWGVGGRHISKSGGATAPCPPFPTPLISISIHAYICTTMNYTLLTVPTLMMKNVSPVAPCLKTYSPFE